MIAKLFEDDKLKEETCDLCFKFADVDNNGFITQKVWSHAFVSCCFLLWLFVIVCCLLLLLFVIAVVVCHCCLSLLFVVVVVVVVVVVLKHIYFLQQEYVDWACDEEQMTLYKEAVQELMAPVVAKVSISVSSQSHLNLISISHLNVISSSSQCHLRRRK